MVQLQTARTRARNMSRSPFMVTIFPLNILPSFRNFLFLSLSPHPSHSPITHTCPSPPHSSDACPCISPCLDHFVLPVPASPSPAPTPVLAQSSPLSSPLRLRAPRPSVVSFKRCLSLRPMSQLPTTTPALASLRPQPLLACACPCVSCVTLAPPRRLPQDHLQGSSHSRIITFKRDQEARSNACPSFLCACTSVPCLDVPMSQDT